MTTWSCTLCLCLLLLLLPCPSFSRPKTLLLETKQSESENESDFETDEAGAKQGQNIPFRKQLLLLQKGVSKAFRHVKAKLEREGAGDTILAQLDQLDKINKAQMEAAAGSSALSGPERQQVKKAVKMIKKGAIKNIEKGLEEALKLKEAEDADYQGGLAGLLGGGGGGGAAQAPAQGAAPPAPAGGGGGGIGGILQALLPVALQVIGPLLSGAVG